LCSLLSCARLTIGLDHVNTPRGMVTDNSQLVLRADRMLSSRRAPPVACSLTTAICPDYTPPHGKQAALLIGTKVSAFHPPYRPSQTESIGGPVLPLSRSARLYYPSFKVLLPAWSSEVAVRKQSKRYRHRSIVILHLVPPAEIRIAGAFPWPTSDALEIMIRTIFA
jgi:hypothetical protein